ncbi:MAG: Glutamine--fructose-6-phosphate aminotransferase (isomerizing) [Bacteroidetes bacterium ADurb.Bin145]|nr:MAG: Glutamine--fructose-6-phosphate aminotransferase (isomerizing) [Bacteroidetes bacterium ADurb.Bin145]
MCGIFGLINNNPDYSSGKIFKSLCLLSESRGKEASGFAVVKDRKIHVFKTPFAASEMVKSNVFKNEILKADNKDNTGFTAIGHSRLVTNGYEQDEKNNQPVVRNGYVVIHNGIIVNQKDLWRKYEREKKMSDLDSELIPVIIKSQTEKGSDMGSALGILFSEIYGMTNIALISSSGYNLYLATNNGSIYYIDDLKNKFFVFASERFILQQLIKKHNLPYTEDSIMHLEANKQISVGLKRTNAEVALIGNHVLDADVVSPPFDIINLKSDTNSKTVYINTSLEHETRETDPHFIDVYESRKEEIGRLRRCTKCILPETFPFIEFDDSGVCNYCNSYKKHTVRGKDELLNVVDRYRKTNGEAECLVPFSGGRDSSYSLHFIVKELGLKPIAFSYDWGMITDLARRNQSRMCGKLGVEHILVSADIRKKRVNIRKNVLAWLKRPSLGTVPLFMAGDKQYFYFANLLMKQNDLNLSILGENLLETTNFKSGFCGIKPNFGDKHTYSLKFSDKLKLASFYGKQYLVNPAYLNSSLYDTLDAYRSYYVIKHNNLNIYDYIKWEEKTIKDTLINEYRWETDPGTKTTWRIGDGTAAFYNYIYYILAGFTENDTFRSNQIREGDLDRGKALELSVSENKPRWDSILWYCRTIGIDFTNALQIISSQKRLYGER